MIAMAKVITDQEVRAAAEYFAALKPRPWIRVVETDTVPKSYFSGTRRLQHPDGGTEPIGKRIIEKVLRAAEAREAARKARDIVEEATRKRCAISAIRTVCICFFGIFLRSACDVVNNGVRNFHPDAQRYAQQRWPNEPMTVQLMLSGTSYSGSECFARKSNRPKQIIPCQPLKKN